MHSKSNNVEIMTSDEVENFLIHLKIDIEIMYSQ